MSYEPNSFVKSTEITQTYGTVYFWCSARPFVQNEDSSSNITILFHFYTTNLLCSIVVVNHTISNSLQNIFDTMGNRQVAIMSIENQYNEGCPKSQWVTTWSFGPGPQWVTNLQCIPNVQYTFHKRSYGYSLTTLFTNAKHFYELIFPIVLFAKYKSDDCSKCSSFDSPLCFSVFLSTSRMGKQRQITFIILFEVT